MTPRKFIFLIISFSSILAIASVVVVQLNQALHELAPVSAGHLGLTKEA